MSLDGTDRSIRVAHFAPALREDFFRLHTAQEDGGWCFCSAWWLDTWEGWGGRSASQNREVRQGLLDAGEYDGYLLYVDDQPAGWCQVGRRDRLVKLVRQFGQPPDAGVWAITCFMIAPGFRGQGLASRLLQDVLADLQQQGVRYVEAYPKRGVDLAIEDLWTGPEAMFIRAGFEILRDDPARPVLRLKF